MRAAHSFDRDLLAGEDPTLELVSLADPTADLISPSENTPVALHSVPVEVAPPAASKALLTVAPQPQGEILHGRYRLDRALAIGGSSIVYRATDLQPTAEHSAGSLVAIKIPRPDMRQRVSMSERLKCEYDYTASLHHPNIVRVFELDAQDGVPFFSMEYLRGEPLSVRLQRERVRPLPERAALHILRGCGAALAYAHTRGVLHCDFKPSNVFLTTENEVKVLDFGAACTVTSGLNTVAKKPESATPAYASPQLLSAECPDVRDDVFSLACVAYELFAGQHPFGGLSSVEMFNRGLSLMPPAALSPERWRVIASALSSDRDSRPASVEEFLALFDAKPPRVSPTLLRRGILIGAAVLLVAAVIFGRRATDDAAINWNHPRTVPMTASTKVRELPIVQLEQSIASFRTRHLSPLVTATLNPMEPLVAVASADEPMAFKATRRVPARLTTVASGVHAPVRKAKALAEGIVTLDQPRLEVSGRSIAAVLTLRRTGSLTGRVAVQWHTEGGSARPTVDYEPVANGAVTLADGQSTRALFIPLKSGAVKPGVRTFAVELKDAKGVSLGGVKRAVVVIKNN